MGVAFLIPAAIAAHQLKIKYESEAYELKKQINKMIATHKPELDKLNKLA
jgi:hypothetical protein